MQLPWATGVSPDEGTNALFQAAKLQQQKRQQASELMLNQQRLGLDQARMNAENARAEAESKRADAASRREDRMASLQERQFKQQAHQAALPYLDPSSPDFSPERAVQMYEQFGASAEVAPSNAQDPGPAPAAPQAPGFVGPIDTPEHAKLAATLGRRSDHAGQVRVDQEEAGNTSLVPNDYDNPKYDTAPMPPTSDAFNFPAGQLPHIGSGRKGAPAEGDWFPDPRGQVTPDATRAGDQAAQEAMQQAQERADYEKQLAEAPGRQAQHSKRLADYQEAKQFPTLNVDMGDGQPFSINTRALHNQSESARQMRVEHWKGALSDDADALKVAVPMAAMGRPDDEIAKAINADRLTRAKVTGQENVGAGHDQARIDAAKLRAARKGAGGGLGHGKAWDKEESELSGELKNYEARSGLTGTKGIAEGQRELESALNEAQGNPNGATQLRIMDKMVRSATGLGVRNQTLNTYMSHLGGLAAQGEGKLEQWASGKMGQDQWRNVVESIRSQLSELQAQGGKANEDYQQMIKSNPSFARHPDLIKRRESEMFGGLHGFGGQTNPLLNAARNAKIQQMPAPDRAAIDWADKHPSDPRSGQILKLHGL